MSAMTQEDHIITTIYRTSSYAAVPPSYRVTCACGRVFVGYPQAVAQAEWAEHVREVGDGRN